MFVVRGLGVVVLALIMLPHLANSASAPTLFTDSPELDRAFAQAVDGIAADVQDGVFLAGTTWPQVWTRDTSYAVDLGAHLVQPKVAKDTMLRMTERDPELGEVWLQDKCGHFGGWPNLTDAIVGAVGAWRIYLESADRDFLAWAYGVTKNSLARAQRDAWEPSARLFKGCSTYMESNSGYPLKYKNNGALMGQTKALSTNLLYWRGYTLAAHMGERLGAPLVELEMFAAKAQELKDAISARLWQENLGYFAYFEDELGRAEPVMEGSGEAFAVLWGAATPEQIRAIFARTPTTPAGLPSLWPQYPEWTNTNAENSSYYHNGMVWPFVQAYWGWAAARAGDVDTFTHELEKMVSAAQCSAPLSVGLHEFYRPFDSLPDGSPNQLWSNAGLVAMVVRGLVGLDVGEDDITVRPLLPDHFSHVQLRGLKVRDMLLDVHVHGNGVRVQSVRLDGQAIEKARVPANLAGQHALDVAMVD